MAVDRSSLDCAVIHTCVGFGGEKKRGRGVVALMQDFNPSIHMTDSDFAIFTQASCPLLPARQSVKCPCQSTSINRYCTFVRLLNPYMLAVRLPVSFLPSYLVLFLPYLPIFLSLSFSFSTSRSLALSLFLHLSINPFF